MAGSWREVGGGERSPPVNERGATPLFRVGECPSPRSLVPSPNGKKLGAGEFSKIIDFYLVFDKTVIHKYLRENKVTAQFSSIKVGIKMRAFFKEIA